MGHTGCPIKLPAGVSKQILHNKCAVALSSHILCTYYVDINFCSIFQEVKRHQEQ